MRDGLGDLYFMINSSVFFLFFFFFLSFFWGGNNCEPERDRAKEGGSVIWKVFGRGTFKAGIYYNVQEHRWRFLVFLSHISF